MSKPRECHVCGAFVPAKQFCQTCVDRFPLRPAATTMTPDEREREMRLLFGPLEIPFGKLHQRIEELVGRPVWTHEMGLCVEELIAEARARTGQMPTAEALLKPLADMGAGDCHSRLGAARGAAAPILPEGESVTDPNKASSPAVQQEGLGPPSAGSPCDVCGREGARGREREALISYDADEAEECYRLGYERRGREIEALKLGCIDAVAHALGAGNATPKEAPSSLSVAAEAVQGKLQQQGGPAAQGPGPKPTPPACWFVTSFDPPGGDECAKPVGHAGPHLLFCGARLTVRSIPHLELRCRLVDEHPGPHRNGSSEWTSEQPPAGPPSSSLTSQSGDPEER